MYVLSADYFWPAGFFNQVTDVSISCPRTRAKLSIRDASVCTRTYSSFEYSDNDYTKEIERHDGVKRR